MPAKPSNSVTIVRHCSSAWAVKRDATYPDTFSIYTVCLPQKINAYATREAHPKKKGTWLKRLIHPNDFSQKFHCTSEPCICILTGLRAACRNDPRPPLTHTPDEALQGIHGWSRTRHVRRNRTPRLRALAIKHAACGPKTCQVRSSNLAMLSVLHESILEICRFVTGNERINSWPPFHQVAASISPLTTRPWIHWTHHHFGIPSPTGSVRQKREKPRANQTSPRTGLCRRKLFYARMWRGRPERSAGFEIAMPENDNCSLQIVKMTCSNSFVKVYH